MAKDWAPGRQSIVRLGLASVASPLEVGANEASSLAERLLEALGRQTLPGLEIVSFPLAITDAGRAVEAGRFFYDRRVHALCIIAASWFEDYLVVDALEECDVPVIAWARPGMETGALCGTQQLAFLLRSLGRPFLTLYDPIPSERATESAWNYARAAALRYRLRRARIGYLGHRVEGMTETTAHELALKKVLGPRVVGLDGGRFLERVDRIAPDSLSDEWNRLKTTVGRVTCEEEDGLDSLRVYHALREVIVDSALDAVAVGCYPHLMGRVCLAASLLGEEGVPVACEGDVNGGVGMLMLTSLSGKPIHNTDLLDPLPEENAIVFSHCGSGGLTLAATADAIELGPVRLMDRGLCCRFPARAGPVTLLNVVPTLDGYRLGTLYGEALPTDMVFPGNPLRVRFECDCRDILAWITSEGLGHHWMAAYGDLRPPLTHLAEMVGCEHRTMG